MASLTKATQEEAACSQPTDVVLTWLSQALPLTEWLSPLTKRRSISITGHFPPLDAKLTTELNLSTSVLRPPTLLRR